MPAAEILASRGVLSVHSRDSMAHIGLRKVQVRALAGRVERVVRSEALFCSRSRSYKTHATFVRVRVSASSHAHVHVVRMVVGDCTAPPPCATLTYMPARGLLWLLTALEHRCRDVYASLHRYGNASRACTCHLAQPRHDRGRSHVVTTWLPTTAVPHSPRPCDCNGRRCDSRQA